jgi:hypothetical protein
MNDSYQAVYDAVRSRFSGCDVGQAIRDACHLDGSWAIEAIRNDFQMAASAMQDPSVLYRPAISIDGNKWCALYGDNLQNGVSGFGDSPAEAMAAFNIAWFEKLPEADHV